MVEHNIAFRVDATSQIGTGHFMRCLTLASELKSKGAHIRFVSRNLPVHLCDMLAEKEMEFIPLNNNAKSLPDDDLAHSCWLGVSQAQDAQATIQALSDQCWDWLVVDHYALDARWESTLRGSAKQIMVIDDIADRQHDCDLLLDQNLYLDMPARYVDKVPAHCQLFLGPRYALLRDEFRELRGQLKPRKGSIKRILVFFGGVDMANCTGLAIEALAGLMAKSLQVDVVIGAQHPSRIEIESSCAEQGYACHVQTSHMAELMAGADLAIGAGGSATWERCCLGLPALLVSVAANQTDIAKTLDMKGACFYLGASEEVNVLALRNAIANMIGRREQLIMMTQVATSLVDGGGVDRVCRELGF